MVGRSKISVSSPASPYEPDGYLDDGTPLYHFNTRPYDWNATAKGYERYYVKDASGEFRQASSSDAEFGSDSYGWAYPDTYTDRFYTTTCPGTNITISLGSSVRDAKIIVYLTTLGENDFSSKNIWIDLCNGSTVSQTFYLGSIPRDKVGAFIIETFWDGCRKAHYWKINTRSGTYNGGLFQDGTHQILQGYPQECNITRDGVTYTSIYKLADAGKATPEDWNNQLWKGKSAAEAPGTEFFDKIVIRSNWSTTCAYTVLY